MKTDQLSMPAPKEMDRLIEQLDERGIKLDKLAAAAKTKEQESALLAKLSEELQKINPDLKDSVDKLAEHLLLYKQENAAKEKWWVWKGLEKIGGYVWKGVKANIYTYAGVGALLLAAGGLLAVGYYTGAGDAVLEWIQDWIAEQGLGGVTDAGKEAIEKGADQLGDVIEGGKGALDGAKEIIGGDVVPEPGPVVPEPGPVVPEPVPMPRPEPLPEKLPSLDEAEKIFRNFERGGG